MDKNESKFTNDVDNLIREFENSSDSEKRELSKQAKEMQLNQKKFEKSLTDLQESLDYLRICIKYQVFDLEATRRENAYLERLLESNFDNDELIG